jgi:cyclophilin family peptidyl-prolyl cis-trans isomerase
LEERWTPTANASGVLSGTALINSGNGIVDLVGISITLTGTTSQGQPATTVAVTDGNGNFSFMDVLPGSYQISAGSGLGLLGSPSFTNLSASPGVDVISGLGVGGGQSVTQDVVFRGLDAQHIFGDQFLTSTTAADFPYTGTAGSGTGLANYRPNNAPVVRHPVGSFTVPVNSAPTFIDAAGYFSDPDIDATGPTEVTFNTSAGPINVNLFDNTAPQTVANFLDYLNSGAYNNSVYTRLQSGFVLQGGGAVLQTSASGSSLVATPTANPVPVENEFSGASNATDTLAMALNGNNPNTGSDEFFFNLANNGGSPNNLDAQDFTAFGQVADAGSQAVLNALVNSETAINNESASPAAASLPNVNLSTFPLNAYTGTNFPTDATAANFLTNNSFTIDHQDEILTYSVVGDTHPGLVTASLTNEFLKLSYAAGQTGNATITVRATDRYGATADTSFTVTVAPEPPVVGSVTLGSTAANTLTATVTASDPNDLPVSLAYVWKLNGSTVRTESASGSLTDTLPLGTPLSATDQVTVQVTPSDSLATGTAVTAGPGPEVTNLTVAADSATATTTLTATPTTFGPDGSTVTNTFQWFKNGTAISGQRAQSLNLAALTGINVGDQFTVQVTPSDGTFTGAAVMSKPVTINTTSTSSFTLKTPVVTAVAIAADSATNVTTLTATPTSAGPDTYTFQWFHNGTAISGATGQSLNLTTLTTPATVNDKFAVQVTPAEGALSGAGFLNLDDAVQISGTSPITIAAPVIQSVGINPDHPTTTSTLTATVFSKSAAAFSYQWFQNGTPLSGATSSTLNLATLSGVHVGDNFAVRVTPDEGPVGGAAVTFSITVAS